MDLQVEPLSLIGEHFLHNTPIQIDFSELWYTEVRFYNVFIGKREMQEFVEAYPSPNMKVATVRAKINNDRKKHEEKKKKNLQEMGL